MDLARALRRAPLTARKKGSGYENGPVNSIYIERESSLEWAEPLIMYFRQTQAYFRKKVTNFETNLHTVPGSLC
jgi:hypothetical protein